MGIENKNQPRPTAIVSATPTHHSSTPFPPPPSFAMFSITVPVKNRETSTRIQQIEAGYDPTPPPPPPKPPPKNQIFLENSLINDDLLFVDVVPSSDLATINPLGREKLTTIAYN